MSLSRSFRPLGLTLSGLLATAVLALVPVSAQAAVKAPTGLTPTGSTSSSTPTFTWTRVSGATQYDLVVSVSGNPIIQTSTANNRFVPTTNLPDGAISWQVRADTPSGNSAWATANATISPTAAPTPVSPIGGDLLTQPDNPPLFSWSPVSGASGYELQVDNNGSFTSPAGDYLPSGTSYFVSSPQAPGTWIWRVRAIRGNGLYTAWSNTASYVVGQLDDPQPGADMTPSPTMQDVSLDWQAVPGAARYQLQVGKDPDFNTKVDDVTVLGTRYQPTQTYNNGGYFWRVRAIDAANNAMPWTDAAPWTFQRNWPQKPTLQYPLNQFAPTVGNPMFYQWTPVRHATLYQLDVGNDLNFSPGTFTTCLTSSTTYAVNGNCAALGQGQTTYWRVKALDYPSQVEGIFSDIHHFVYSGGQITQTSPTNGSTVDIPTLDWAPSAGTQTYHVVIRDKDSNVVANVDTSSTSWTPESRLPTTGNPYTWTVQSTPYGGNISPLYPGITFNVSGNTPSVGTALVPETGVAGDPATEEFPSLTWGPLAGATYYRVRIGVLGSGFYDTNASHISGAAYPYASATDTGTHYLSPGTYYWFVDAYDGGNHLLGETSPADYGQFTIKDLPDASGQTIALDGLADVSNSAGCSNALANTDPSTVLCTGVPATPVLRWAAEAHAAGYAIYLGNDREFTSRVSSANPYALTTNTMWTPTLSDLPDNTAQGAYYWYVRPCKSMQPLQCNPDPISTNAAATNAFRKLSPAVQLNSPGNGAAVTTEPTFSWADYYVTNQAVAYADGADPSYQTAKAYHVQVATLSTFGGSTVVDQTVDQPFYTPSAGTLPQGTLYWRVQALDPANNALTWSEVRTFSNNQPPVDLTASGAVPSPVGGVTVAGSTPFRWTPMNGASSYTIEVYKNDDAGHSPLNRVIFATTQEPSYVSTAYLPPSSDAYRWRVSWTDAGNRARPFSADGRFFVTASSVSLKTPAANTFQKNNGLYYSWNPVPLAALYRVEVKDANGGSSSVETAATAYAPSIVNDGAYQWRVVALDPSRGAIATSAWRTFKVDATKPTVTAWTPNSLGKPTSRVTVTFSEKVAGVTTSTFQLHQVGRASKLAAALKVASDHRSATLIPGSRLRHGKTYTAKITNTVHDAAGNHLTTFTWSFSV